LEDLALLIVKNHLPMHIIKANGLKKIVNICVQGLFCLLKDNFQKKFCQSWWKKTKQLYVLLTLAYCYFIIIGFDQ
jgi:hypothetical protein